MAKVTKEEAYIIGSAQKRFRDEYQKKRKKERIQSKILWILFLIVTVLIVFNTGFYVYEYHGTGMSSVCSEGDIIVTNRLSYLVNKPQRGELVTIKEGKTADLKRVVGLPGDEISFVDGDLYINGSRCIEAYTDDYTESDVTNIVVPEGGYYVLNDDREDMNDSRSKDVLQSDIKGAEIAIIRVPSFVKTNDVYKAVAGFFKAGASVAGNIENAVTGAFN